MAIKEAEKLQNKKVYRYDEVTLPVEASLLPSEVHVALSYDGVTHVVMMATPSNMEDLAWGFTLSENLVPSATNIYDVEVSMRPGGMLLDVKLSHANLIKLKQLRRNMQGRSGHGLKGSEALSASNPPLQPLPESSAPNPIHFYKLQDRIRELQKDEFLLEPLHSAMLINEAGNIALFMEDISRHNALDKVFGAATRKMLDLTNACVVTTSRCCIELVQKTIRMGIPSLATLAPPSSSAVKTARQFNLNLIYLPESDYPKMYSGKL
ncbi:formate dehydrogenase accessory sulfurtransferase FdhD [Endozoicomonadaceae bacterium StTr2]